MIVVVGYVVLWFAFFTVVVLAVELPYFPEPAAFVVIVVGSLFGWVFFSEKSESKERVAKEKKGRVAKEMRGKAEKSTRRESDRKEQQQYFELMVNLGDRSLGIFEAMVTHLDSAEKSLDQAEVDFGEGAFAPYWDSVQNAAMSLAAYEEAVSGIKDNSSKYIALTKKYKRTPPEFPVVRRSVEKLGVGTATAKRMQAIVRQAQRDFQFAMIYEQRKTNRILVGGFTNLADALNDMTWRITDSIDSLASSVDVMASTLDESMQAIHARTGDMHGELLKVASDRAGREKKAVEMLDNIQRRRKLSRWEGPHP